MQKYSSVRLEITSGCNLHCKYCHNSDFNNRYDDMSTDEILRLLKNLKDVYDVNKVLITGGEPLTQHDLTKIISYISSLGIKPDMVTNGILLTDSKIKELDKAGLKRVRISIDEVNDCSLIRSKENPSNLWNTAAKVKELSNNIEVCIHTVCTPSNVDNLFEVYKKVLEVGAKRWRVFDLGFQGEITNQKKDFDFTNYYQKLIASTKKILEHYISNNIKEKLDIEINNVFRTLMLRNSESQEYINVDIEKALEARANKSPCDYVTEHQLTIRSNGKGTLCQYFHNTIFDFKGHDFDVEKTIIDKKDVIENEIIMKDVKPCMNCKYCLVCNGGCRSRAQFLTGSIYDADPAGCVLYQLIFSELLPIFPKSLQKEYEAYTNLNGTEPKYSQKDLKEIFESKGY